MYCDSQTWRVGWETTAFCRFSKYEVIRNEDGISWDLNFTLNSGRIFTKSHQYSAINITINQRAVLICTKTGSDFRFCFGLLRDTYIEMQLLPLWMVVLEIKYCIKGVLCTPDRQKTCGFETCSVNPGILTQRILFCKVLFLRFLYFHFTNSLKSEFIFKKSETSLSMCEVWFDSKLKSD